MKALEVFWAEWDNQAPGETRSIERARLLTRALGIEKPESPVLTVVGSKGKGTAATYASAFLAATGARVVTVTSPSLRGIRDRIRVGGRAISEHDLGGLAEQLETARGSLPPYGRGGGYLSPSGLFIIAGVLHAKSVHADFIVLEAGMGGASDEVSLFAPTVVAITSVFGEHLGVLGHTPAEIAADKAGVATADTRTVVSLPQESSVTKTISERVAAGTGGLTSVETFEPGTSGIPRGFLPVGFGRSNAELGCVAAERLLTAMGRAAPDDKDVPQVLPTVHLPGRQSWHEVPGTRSEIWVDAAISRAGVAAALTEVSQQWSDIDRVFVCMPDHKDVAGTNTELAELPVTFVRLTDKPWLNFTRALPSSWEVVDIDAVDRDFLAARGQHLVALGTGYFIARILDLVDADTERIFHPLSDAAKRDLKDG